MSVTISNKAMILSDYENLLPTITGVLSSIEIEHYSKNGTLTSLPALQKKLKEEGNFSFLKKDTLAFIEKNGYPFIIIIDMKVNSGLDNDRDNNKVLKTLLISYIIIMQSEQFKNISCNILIFADKNEYNHFKTIHKLPQNILGILKTNDERLNNLINEYTTNNEKYKKNFNILVTDAEQELSLIKSELILFINMIRAKEKLKNKLVTVKPEPADNGPKIEAAKSAEVVLRSGNIIYRNGEPPVECPADSDLTEKEVYIDGNFTSYTRLDVIDKLLNLLKTGFGSEINFKKGDSLILNIPKNSIIDSTTPITLAQLLSKELIEYKNIRIKTSPVHYQLMLKSKGFSMIQKNVIIQES